MIDTSLIDTNEDNEKGSVVAQDFICKVCLKFDGTELYSKYSDFTWAKDVQLEKLSLCRLGLRMW